MRCIVCDNDIRIDSLNQLFAFQPLLLCSCCSQNLIPKSTDILYEDNEWIRSVINRLNQGDIILIKLFKNRLQKILAKKSVTRSKIKIIEAKQDLPYPWLEVLVDSLNFDKMRKHSTIRIESIIVSVREQKNANQQIVILD